MKITNHIHQLRVPFKITISTDIQINRFVNIFIIAGKHITLIDTGVAGSEVLIYDYLEFIGRKKEEIKWVLLTHTHPDHIGALKTIKEQTGCKVAVPVAEKDWLEDVDKQFHDRPVPGFHDLVAGSCHADILIKDNDILDIDEGLEIKAIHTPGHSKGSTSFVFEKDDVIIVGDAVPVKGDIPIYDDYSTSLKTLEKLENLPYANFLLSSWDTAKEGDEVEITISNGFEVLYAVHTAYLESKAENNSTEITTLTQQVLQKMGFPSKFINPLFIRAIKSHEIK